MLRLFRICKQAWKNRENSTSSSIYDHFCHVTSFSNLKRRPEGLNKQYPGIRPDMIFGASRLLARVLKEDVQIWYNDTSTVKRGGGGGRENVPLENLWSLRYFMSICVPISSFEILALWVCAAMLLYLITTFSFSQVHHQIDQNVKCIIIMRIEAISFQIY
jgi:hypothetical protein